MAERMIALASRMPGFLGVKSARSADGLGITGLAGSQKMRFETGKTFGTRRCAGSWQKHLV